MQCMLTTTVACSAPAQLVIISIIHLNVTNLSEAREENLVTESNQLAHSIEKSESRRVARQREAGK